MRPGARVRFAALLAGAALAASMQDRRHGALAHACANQDAAENPADDHEQVLREAFELLDDADLPAALRAMQRVAIRAPAQTLVGLNDWTRTIRGEPLDELLAETRMRVARTASHGKTFDIRFATAFEGPALGRKLERLADECLSATFSGKTVAAWSRQPEDYRELHSDSPELEYQARLAAAAIAARLSHDPRVRAQGSRTGAHPDARREKSKETTAASAPAAPTRGDLVRLRDALARLSSHVRSLPGFTALTTRRDDASDPTLREAQRLETERVERERGEAERRSEDRPEADPTPASRPSSRPTSSPAK